MHNVKDTVICLYQVGTNRGKAIPTQVWTGP